MRKFFLSLVALGLVASPTAAQTIDDNDRLSSAPLVIFGIAAVAVAIFALDGDDNDEPISA